MNDVGTLHRVPLLKTEDSIKLGDRTVPFARNFGYKYSREPYKIGTIIEFNLVV